MHQSSRRPLWATCRHRCVHGLVRDLFDLEAELS
jgi:hypothetical protein